MRPGRRARTRDPRPAADHARPAWRCGAGPRTAAAGRARRPGRRTRHGVHRGHLDRVCLGQVGQEAGQPSGEHRLAGAGRSDHEQVMAAGRGDLETGAGLVLTDDVRQVERHADGCRPAAARPRPRATQESGRPRRTPRPPRPGTGLPRPARPGRAAPRPRSPRRPRRCTAPRRRRPRRAGSTPRTGRSRPSRPSSPRWTTPCGATGSMTSAPASVATAIARSKPEPGLGQRRRREVHRDAAVGPRHARRGHGRPDPVPATRPARRRGARRG